MTGFGSDRLLFLISQPRAGSTMLQRMLGAHPEIHTAAEPWLMLPLLYPLRTTGHSAEYDARRAAQALHEFLHTLPAGEEEYFRAARQMALYLYENSTQGEHFFLDKTPRYYLVIPELLRTFPQARFIFLLRNPLAVLHSVLRTWTRWSWLGLYRHRQDLLDAPGLLLEGIERAGERGRVVHYERIVARPEKEIKGLCAWLGIGFDPAMVEYGRADLPQWGLLGDQTGVYTHQKPTAKRAEKWRRSLDSPQFWRLAHDYLHGLGKETIEGMGYPFDELAELVQVHRPSPPRRWAAFSLAWLTAIPPKQRSRWVRGPVRLARRLDRPEVGTEQR